MKDRAVRLYAAGPLGGTADPHNEKIFKRELLRLEASLKLGAAADPEEILCFLHYPPLYASYRCGEIIELLHKYGVKRCIYGHLHGKSLSHAVNTVPAAIASARFMILPQR